KTSPRGLSSSPSEHDYRLTLPISLGDPRYTRRTAYVRRDLINSFGSSAAISCARHCGLERNPWCVWLEPGSHRPCLTCFSRHAKAHERPTRARVRNDCGPVEIASAGCCHFVTRARSDYAIDSTDGGGRESP